MILNYIFTQAFCQCLTNKGYYFYVFPFPTDCVKLISRIAIQGGNMNYNMKEIAKLAHVSQPTVSRVINGNTNVNPELRKRVLQVIESVGFQPNRAAQTLKNQNSFLIGVSVTSISNPYFMDLIESIEYEARSIGYNIILHNCENNILIEQNNLKNFIARQVDGVIIVPESDENLDILNNYKIPTVVITHVHSDFNSISISHEKGGALAADYFIRKGVQHFLYIGQGPYGKDLKFEGYKNELYANGMNFIESNYLHHPTETNNSIQLERVIHTYIKEHLNTIFTPSLVEGHENAHSNVGVLCGNDIIAIQFITTAAKYNLTLNVHYHLIGFDDTILSKSYRFSSIRHPIHEMSTHSIKLLMELVSHRITSKNAITLNPLLIERS